MNKIAEAVKNKAGNMSFFTKDDYQATIERIQSLDEDKSIQKNPKDYRLVKKFEILEIQVDGIIIKKLKKQASQQQFVFFEELFDIIHAAHLSTGHSGKILMEHKLSEDYANITREHICTYLQLCEKCQLKKSKVRKSLVVKPIISNQLNSRCQVDLIDMQSQPDGKYKYIMTYQDHLTKFVTLKALESKRAEGVAYHLIDIFCDKGAPHILQSDNGREFANQIVKEVINLWPECRLVHGKPRHSQSQGSVERANRSVEEILACWMRDENSTKWSEGLRFVQWKINTRLHTGIGRTPYEAVFGIRPQLGVVSTNLTIDAASILDTEEQLEEILNSEEEYSKQQMLGQDDIAPDTASITQQSEITNYNCVSCQQISSGAHTCMSCGLFCHAIPPCSVNNGSEEEGFGSAVLCRLCHQANQITQQRKGAKRIQGVQADKMFEQSRKRFKQANIGDTVMVPLPDVDRGKGDFRNIKAVVVAVEHNGTYKLGTKYGQLNSHYTRNQFTPCLDKFLEINDVQTGKEISLRQVARNESVGTGQGMFHCSCKKTCLRTTCKCYRSNRLCHSRCHNNQSCSNK
ncbi:hypothetical protein LOD99_14085 [Oopsacas minuta]|nr:hypothetical protein LOD99_8197 [Oopsacas minuta]KAI6651949.1 hypothetical protein LOD99_4828 [Oopsacas minuta]KAI6660501.1 hypothetical protein LOD99_14085 [Oopsacas minuta]